MLFMRQGRKIVVTAERLKKLWTCVQCFHYGHGLGGNWLVSHFRTRLTELSRFRGGGCRSQWLSKRWCSNSPTLFDMCYMSHVKFFIYLCYFLCDRLYIFVICYILKVIFMCYLLYAIWAFVSVKYHSVICVKRESV